MSLPAPTPHTLALADVSLRIWTWGKPSSPPIVLVHGWGDTGASFAAVAASLQEDFYLIAPDLRGYGESPCTAKAYWFPEYLRDLDAVLDAITGPAAITLVGHSMGGNVCGIYAGARPSRIASLVLLEGFGMPETTPSDAPGRYQRWLDQQHTAPQLRDFADEATLLKHLARLAPAASAEVLAQVLPCWAVPLPNGAWRLRMDPAHKSVNATMYRRAEAAACWRATTAPVTLVAGSASDYMARFHGMDPMADAASHYAQATCHMLEGASHMMHWEQPEVVASLIRAAARHTGD